MHIHPPCRRGVSLSLSLSLSPMSLMTPGEGGRPPLALGSCPSSLSFCCSEVMATDHAHTYVCVRVGVCVRACVRACATVYSPLYPCN